MHAQMYPNVSAQPRGRPEHSASSAAATESLVKVWKGLNASVSLLECLYISALAP